MTFEIALVLTILVVSLVLFVTEVIRMDLVALLVMAVLAVTGLVTPAKALEGFSNPAVVTVWAMFILSAGLTRTGVAAIIGRAILGWTAAGEARAILIIALTAGVLSAFMNNIGVAALMLPAVVTVARRTGIPPSRLLMPLAYGSLLGGLTTLIGTPPNLLVANALREYGFEPFGLFDFSPVGGAVMLGGLIFLATVGRHILPRRDPAREASSRDPRELMRDYRLQERTALIRIPDGSPLAGRTLRESRLGSAARLNVFTVHRGEDSFPAPAPDFALRAGDRLQIGGKLDRFEELRGWAELVVEEDPVGLSGLVTPEVGLAEVEVARGAGSAMRTLGQIDFRRRFAGAIVLAIRRDETVLRRELAAVPLREGDRLLVLGRHDALDALAADRDFGALPAAPERERTAAYGLADHVFRIHVPEGSRLEGARYVDTRFGEALGVGVLALRRGDEVHLLPGPDERFRAGDVLYVRGAAHDLEVFRGLQRLVVEEGEGPELAALESERAIVAEAVLSPRTTLAGKTPTELRFRERYGVQILAVLRRGQTIRSNLRDLPLEFGDALLLIGPPERVSLLTEDREFLAMTRDIEPSAAVGKAPLAVGIMAAVVIPALAGWLPIAISAVAGASLMVLTRCISMESAYRAIEWRSIFLIAGMLPLGTALADTGAAALVAQNLVAAVGPWGPWAVLIALYLLTMAATTIIPTAALVVLLAPIALTASEAVGLSPYAVMMAIAMAASASFTSPVSHPANVLVMGPGGYRFVDYVKLGVPLAVVCFLIVLFVLPWFWPLRGE